MYESFYGLKEKPFSLLPDPAFLYLSKQHEMAFTLLEYSLENQAGFCVITGKAGTGKTTLLRRLLNQIGDDVSIGLITNTHHSFGELLRWILNSFSLEDAGGNRARQHQVFIDYLIGQYAKNRRTMLIIDEAQNMSSEALEELRMLSNINSEKDLLLQVVLVGQPPLREILQRPELEQFAQRVAVDYHLDSLSAKETREYIRHRLRVAGGEHELFSDDACEAIYAHSGGIPRLINLLCDLSLVYAYAERAAVITGDLVEQIINERDQHGALPVFAQAPVTGTVQRPVLKQAALAMAIRPDETEISRAARQPEAYQAVPERWTASVVKQVTRMPPPIPSISAQDRLHSVTSATALEKVNFQALPPADDASTAAGAAEKDTPLTMTAASSDSEIVSVAPVASVSLMSHGGASDVSPAIKPNELKPVAARLLTNSGKSGREASRGAAAGWVASIRRYVPVLTVLVMMSGVSFAWYASGKPDLLAAFIAKESSSEAPMTSQPSVPEPPIAASESAPPAAPSVSDNVLMQEKTAKLPDSGKEAEAEEKLKQIERERDAIRTIAESAAREREAMRAAARARERALTAEHEAALARERERADQLAQAAEKAAQQARAAAVAAVLRAKEPESMVPMATVNAEKTAEANVANRQPVAQDTSRGGAFETETTEAPAFTANPCKGPSARFLSTCE